MSAYLEEGDLFLQSLLLLMRVPQLLATFLQRLNELLLGMDRLLLEPAILIARLTIITSHRHQHRYRWVWERGETERFTRVAGVPLAGVSPIVPDPPVSSTSIHPNS